MEIEKDKINRMDLKQNMMKHILFKVDYQGVVSIEVLMTKLNEYIQTKFSNYETKFLNGLEIQVNSIQELSETLSLPVKEITKQPLHVFTGNKFGSDQLTLTISKYFTELNIQCKDYKTIDEYLIFFQELFFKLKEFEHFISEKRFGLRKIGFGLFNERDEIFDQFEKKIMEPECPGFPIKEGTSVQKLRTEKYDIIFRRQIEEGIILEKGEQKKAYKATLDIDGVLTENDLKNNTQKEWSKLIVKI